MWRIEPERVPITRTIDVGVGVTFLAYDAGAIWTANYNDGTVSRIDVKTNDVEATPVGAVQGLAAGEGSAWVSAAGATLADGLPETCGQMLSRAADPDLLIASDLLLRGPIGAGPRAMADADPARPRDRATTRRAGTPIGYRSCDDSNAQTGNFDRRHVRGECQRLRAREEARGGDRHLQLGLRAGRDPDPQPGARRAARDDQPGEHAIRA